MKPHTNHRDRLSIPVLLCLAGLLLVGISVGVVRGAWISHRLDTFVWIQGDWQVGEYRSCEFLLPTARLFCGGWESTRHGGSLSEFISGVGNDDFAGAFRAVMTPSTETDWTPLGKYFHVFPVLFKGRIKTPNRDRVVMSLLCQRKYDALSCNSPD
jgi:hypothetical protein